jgi:hypothetical protein
VTLVVMLLVVLLVVMLLVVVLLVMFVVLLMTGEVVLVVVSLESMEFTCNMLVEIAVPTIHVKAHAANQEITFVGTVCK